VTVSSPGYDRTVSTRQFAVRCVRVDRFGSDEQLRAELTAHGLDEVVVVPDTEGDRLTIRGLAPAESRDATRDFVEHVIYDVTLDLIIVEPGVWVDDSIR
jgi:hypothetical protein